MDSRYSIPRSGLGLCGDESELDLRGGRLDVWSVYLSDLFAVTAVAEELAQVAAGLAVAQRC